MQNMAKILQNHACFQRNLYLLDPSSVSPQPRLEECLLLRPSPQFPPYAVASLCDLFQELNDLPHAHLPQVDQTNVGQNPYMVMQTQAYEHLADVIAYHSMQDASALPLSISLCIVQQLLQALNYLHARKFVHGGIKPLHIHLHYSDPLLGQGGLQLHGLIHGSLEQMSPAGAEYGRGSEADTQAVLMLFMDLMLGQVDRTWRASHERKQHLLSIQQAQVEDPTLFQWCQAQLAQPTPLSASLLYRALQQQLAQGLYDVFNASALGRWLGRLCGHRKLDWQALLQGDRSALNRLYPKQNIQQWPPEWLVSPVSSQASGQAGYNAGHIGQNNQVAHHPNQNLGAHQNLGQPQAYPQQSITPSNTSANMPIKTAEAQGDMVADNSENQAQAKAQNVGRTKSRKKPKKVKVKKQMDSDLTFLEKVDFKLDEWEDTVREKMHKPIPSQLKVRVAVLWNDTITSETYHNLTGPLTIGPNKADHIKFPTQLENQDSYTLITPSANGMLVHVPRQAEGWFIQSGEEGRKSWNDFDDAKMSLLPVNSSGLIKIQEDQDTSLAIWLQLIYTDVTEPRFQFTFPVPRGEAGLFWSLSFALLAHLTLIVMAFASKNFSLIETAVLTESRFVEVEVTVQEEKIEEEPEEEEKEETEVEETVSEDVENVNPEPSEIKETIKERASERFGKGQNAVNALADFLNGSELQNDRVSLGDAMNALEDANVSVGMGSVFGSEDGAIDLGGSMGSLDTSGGSAGSQKASRLKGKRVARRPKGKVRHMKSRARQTGGTLSAAAVYKEIGRHLGRISACYESALIKKPQLSGKLTVQWTINTSGRVGQVKQKRSSLGDPKLTQCVFKVVKKMKFPKPKGGSVKITYPFVFQRG